MEKLQSVIEDAFEKRAGINASTVTPEVKSAVAEVLMKLDRGELRVAEKRDG